MKITHCFVSLLFLGVAASGWAADKAWKDWQFLLGDWVGEGTGQPGQGTGGFTFAPDLQGQVLIRKSHAEYPATDKRPAYTHNDLMVVYGEAGHTRADYYDNEGHVIRYTVTLAPSGDSATFLSESSAQAPQFRLTYTKKAANELTIKFEIAPPGKAMATYIVATAHRK